MDEQEKEKIVNIWSQRLVELVKDTNQYNSAIPKSSFEENREHFEELMGLIANNIKKQGYKFEFFL